MTSARPNSDTCAAPLNHHDPDRQPNTAPMSFRQVMAATTLGREHFAHLFGNPRWPTAQDLADARAFLARDRAERQGELL